VPHPIIARRTGRAAADEQIGRWIFGAGFAQVLPAPDWARLADRAWPRAGDRQTDRPAPDSPVLGLGAGTRPFGLAEANWLRQAALRSRAPSAALAAARRRWRRRWR
jgi:hypothetical protein